MPHGQLNYDQIRSGSVALKASNYTVVESDAFKLLAFNPSGSPLTTYTATLPAAPASLRSATWWVAISNYGGGVVNVSPNGKNLDGSASSLSLTAGESVVVQTDGINYYTQRGISTAGAGTLLQTNGVNNASQTALNLVSGTNITLTNTSGGNVTIAAAGGSAGVTTSNYQLYDGTHYFAWPPSYQCTVPLAANFSWLNQASAVENASGGQLQLVSSTAGSSVNSRIQTIGTNTKATAVIVPVLEQGGPTSQNPNAGIIFYESSSGHVLMFLIGFNNSTTPQVGIWYFTAPGTFNAVLTTVSLDQEYWPRLTYVMLQLQISGSNLLFNISPDGGATFINVRTEAKTAHFTTGPDNWGYTVIGESTANLTYNNLLSWVTQ